MLGGGEGSRLRLFHVCGILAGRAGDDGVLTRLGEHHELVGRGASDGTGIGLYGPEIEAATLEDAPVGPVHLLVGEVGRFLVCVEGVGVLHDELSPPHEAEA